MQFQKPIDRRELRKPHGMRFAGRVQDRQQRWQQGNTGDESDDHPRPCNLSELGEHAVGGREERGESHRGRQRGQGQRPADLDRRAMQGSAQFGKIVTLGTVPYVELNSEIDA